MSAVTRVPAALHRHRSLALLFLQKFFAGAPFMQHSRALPYFNALMTQVHGWLPPDLTARLGI